MSARQPLPGAPPPAADPTGIDEPAGAEPLPSAQDAALMDRIYERGDRLVTKFILLHALFALSLAGIYQTWLVTGIVTFCAVALFAVGARLLPRTFITRCLAGVSLQIFVALHIYQLHGLAEMHFFFFTAFTMLIVYQDWKCMWPGAIGIIAQHIGFALLHNAGLGTNLFFFDEGYVGFTKLFFHFGIAIGQVALCGYWAYLLRRQTLASAVQNAGLRQLGEQLKRRASQQAATSELSRQALAGKEPRDLLEITAGLVARALEVEYCYVGERAADGENLHVRAEYGYGLAQPLEMLVPAGTRSQGGFTLLSNEPVVVEDLSKETRFVSAPPDNPWNIRSGLSVVVGGREEAFGVLVTESREPRRFTQEDPCS